MVVEESRNYSAGVGLVANTVNVSFPLLEDGNARVHPEDCPDDEE